MSRYIDNLIIPDLDDISKEEHITMAVEAVRASPLLPNGTPELSLRQAAGLFGVPKSTLTDRYNGIRTRQAAHKGEKNLTDAQEEVLVVWLKIMARRGIPLTQETLRQYASDIAQHYIGESWAKRFLSRHQDVKVRWTTSLEACRARALNPTLVREYFDLLYELITVYNIPPENIYNMDEKGILLGVGKRIAALVDRDQKTLHKVEDGNRELVTVIETVCADGSTLHPSVIYQGKRRDLVWGRNNPCGASISHSPKGWTDQELGATWLEKDFEPATATRNKTNGYRLLILDGHNSHCTYCFCKFAEEHRILILCLPSHTTHALQPCDVGVFGPLASCWKAEVNLTSNQYVAIRKNNFLIYYSKARDRAFKSGTIKSAFEKTGIWPFNPDAIPPTAFEPSRNTTTQPTQPIPAQLPASLVPIPEETEVPTASSSTLSPTSTITPNPSTITTGSLNSATSTQTETRYEIAGLPPPLRHTSTRQALYQENQKLRILLDKAREDLERGFAQMQLMDTENGRLRNAAFGQTNTKPRKNSSHSRHLTSEESLDALARAEVESMMAEVFKEAGPLFKKQREEIEELAKQVTRDLANAAKELEQKRKEEEKAAKKAAEAAEKAEAKRVKDQERAAKKAAEMAEKAKRAEERRSKQLAKQAEKDQKAAERKRKKQEKEAEAARKAASDAARPVRGRRRAVVDELDGTVEGTPRARRRAKQTLVFSTPVEAIGDDEEDSEEELDQSPVRRYVMRRRGQS